MNIVDGPYSATCSSQPLTFVESDFVGVENTQASEFNYELTFPVDMNTFQSQQPGSTQQQQQQQDPSSSATQHENNDGLDQVTKDLNTLNFEDDEDEDEREDMYKVYSYPAIPKN